jgi:hypothetical protein
VLQFYTGLAHGYTDTIITIGASLALAYITGQNYNLLIAKKSFENVAKLKC